MVFSWVSGNLKLFCYFLMPDALSSFIEKTDKKYFYYSFVALVSIIAKYRKCLFVLLMAAETQKKIWWNGSICTGILYVLISIQNVSVKTLRPFFMTSQTTAAVLSWFVADSYWNNNLYYGLSKLETPGLDSWAAEAFGMGTGKLWIYLLTQWGLGFGSFFQNMLWNSF